MESWRFHVCSRLLSRLWDLELALYVSDGRLCQCTADWDAARLSSERVRFVPLHHHAGHVLVHSHLHGGLHEFISAGDYGELERAVGRGGGRRSLRSRRLF